MNYLRRETIQQGNLNINRNFVLKIHQSVNQVLDDIPSVRSMQLIDYVIEGQHFNQVQICTLSDALGEHQLIDRALIHWHYHNEDEQGLLISGSVETFTVSIGYQKDIVLTCSGSDINQIEIVLHYAKQNLQRGTLPDPQSNTL